MRPPKINLLSKLEAEISRRLSTETLRSCLPMNANIETVEQHRCKSQPTTSIRSGIEKPRLRGLSFLPTKITNKSTIDVDFTQNWVPLRFPTRVDSAPFSSGPTLFHVLGRNADTKKRYGRCVSSCSFTETSVGNMGSAILVGF